MNCTFSLLLLIACDLGNVLLETTGQRVAGTLGVALGLSKAFTVSS